MSGRILDMDGHEHEKEPETILRIVRIPETDQIAIKVELPEFEDAEKLKTIFSNFVESLTADLLTQRVLANIEAMTKKRVQAMRDKQLIDAIANGDNTIPPIHRA